MKRIMDGIRKWLAPPIFPGDEAKTRQAEVTSFTILVMTSFTALVFIGDIFGGRIPLPTMLIDVFIIGLCIFAQSQLHKGRVKFAGVGIIALGTILLPIIIASLGTVRTPSTAIYLLLVIIAGLLFDRPGILITSILSSLSVAGLIAAENMGILPAPDYSVNITQWVTYTFLFGLTGGLISIAIHATRHALTRAEDELVERKKIEAVLKESEAHYRHISSTISDIAYSCVTDADGFIIDWLSGAVEDITGYTAEELKAMHCWGHLVIGEDYRLFENFVIHLTPGNTGSCDLRIRHKDGNIRWINSYAECVGEEKGHRLYGGLVDITERKQAEDHLHRRTEALTSLQATILDISSPHPLSHLLNLIVERAANLLDASGGGLYLTEPEEHKVRCVVSYKTKEDYTGAVLDYGVGAAGHVAETGQPLIIDDYGKWSGRANVYEEQQPFHGVMSAPMLWQGRVSGVIHVLRDRGARKFTQEELNLLLLFANHAAVAVENTRLFNLLDRELVERKQTEEKLRENRKFLADLIEYSATLVFVKDKDGRYELVNRKFEEMTGIPRGSIIGRTDAECFPESLAFQYRESDLRVIESGRAVEVEDSVDGPGGRRELFTIKFPLYADDGSIRGVCGITTDITERKQAEYLLEQTRKNYETFFNSIDDLLFVLDQKGNILHTNSTVIDRLGYSTQELLGQSVLLVHPPERREEAGRIVGEMLAGTAEFCPVPVITKSGERIPVETRVTPGFWDGEPVIFGVTKDMSQIALSEEKFSKAFHSSPVLMALNRVEDETFIDVNEVFLETLGFSRDEVIGKTPQELGLFSNMERRDAVLEMLWQKKTVRNIDVMMRTKDGVLRNGLFSADTIYIGKELCVLTAMMDITERRRTEEALREKTQELDQFFTTSLDLLCIADTDGIFRRLNQEWANTLGYSLAELEGRPFLDLVHPDDLDKTLGAMSRLGAQKSILNFENRYRCKDGSYRWIEWRSTPVGKLIYAAARDITERKRIENILQLRLELLELAANYSLDEFMPAALDKIAAFTGSTIGFYHFVEPDQKTLLLQAWSTRTLREFCKAEGKGLHYDMEQAGVWVECVRERRPVIHNDYEALPASRRKGLPPGHAPVMRELVVPVYRGEKVVSILGVGNKAANYTEEDAETVSYLADVFWEIVKRKQAEQVLHEVESRTHLLSQNLEGAGLYVYSHDVDGNPHFEYLSAGMEALTGVKVEDALRDTSRIHSAILPEYVPGLMQLEIKSKQDLTRFEMEFRQRNASSGEVRWMLLRSTPRRREDGSTVWYGVQMDITRRKQDEQLLEAINEQLRIQMQEIENLQDELREQALRDPLTGLYNRRYLSETLNRETIRTKRLQQPLSIIAIDIDHFKKVNDTYGHQVGDLFLKEVANLIRNHARGYDFVCRYGGEEFLVVLPGAGTGDAFTRADEIRQRCEALGFPHNGNKLYVTISVGVATYPDHDEDVERVIVKADQALYYSKNAGRNRVTAWNGSQSSVE